MIIIPAIDIKNGKVVRLTQGKFDQETVYNQDPAPVAQLWQAQGASLIHIVDLDGAQTGSIANLDAIIKIKNALSVPIQIGGGIRSLDAIQTLLAHGIHRVVLGTRAVEDLDFVKDVLSQWGERIAISLDCANGEVMKKGWTQASNIQGVELAKTLESYGLKTLIYTDIARDGVLIGPNLKGIVQMLSATRISVIASGGISNLDDVRALLSLRSSQLQGVIIGKALYEKKFTLKEAIDLCSQNE